MYDHARSLRAAGSLELGDVVGGGDDVDGGADARSAATNSAALPNRRAGSFARAFWNTGSSSHGSSGLTSQTEGTSPVTCAAASAATLSASNGRLPARSS